MGPVEERLTKAMSFVERGWSNRFFAANALGKCVSTADPNACSWCALGSLYASNPGTHLDGVFSQCILLLAEQRGVKTTSAGHAYADVTDLNDNKTKNQAEAIDWFKNTIQLAHERGL